MSKPTLKPLLIEFSWLLLALIASILCTYFLLDWQKDGTISIYLYDTYYVITPWVLIIPLFAAISLTVFLTKEIRYGFSRKIPGIIIMVMAVLLIVCISAFHQFIMPVGEFTTYPPLSVLNDSPVAADYENELLIPFSLLIIAQIALAAIALFVAYRLGVARSKTAQNTQ